MYTLNEPGEAFQPNMHLVAHPVGCDLLAPVAVARDEIGFASDLGGRGVLEPLDDLFHHDCSGVQPYGSWPMGLHLCPGGNGPV
jgi:hypothetical protein